MLKIQTTIKPIEMDINGNLIQIPKTDEMLKKLDLVEKKLRDEASKVASDEMADNLARLRAVAIEAYDTLLGDGYFVKIEDSLSEIKGDYTFQMVNHFFKIYQYITNETLEEVDLTRYDKTNIKPN